MTNQFLAFLAAVGIGSIVSAVVGWMSAKAVAISNHRQVWINALRDDVVLFLGEIDKMRFAWAMAQSSTDLGKTLAHTKEIHDARSAAKAVYRRIVLRLNPLEKINVQLTDVLDQLLKVDPPEPTAGELHEQVLDISRKILKHEWAVAKYGVLTRAMKAIKRLKKK